MPYQAGRGFFGRNAIGNETTIGQLASMNRSDYGFKNFYQGRPELTGTHAYDFNWLPHNRPGITEGRGPMGPLPGVRKAREMRQRRGERQGEMTEETGLPETWPLVQAVASGTAPPLARRGALPRGSQFAGRLGAGARPFAELGPASRIAMGGRNPREFNVDPGGTAAEGRFVAGTHPLDYPDAINTTARVAGMNPGSKSRIRSSLGPFRR